MKDLRFGANDDITRHEVLGVLNGVHRLLSNVDYVFPGEDCTPSTYAYVYPEPPWNKNMRGRYVFHLCDLYMDTIEGDKIETLTHEASHHETMCPGLVGLFIVATFLQFDMQEMLLNTCTCRTSKYMNNDLLN